MTDYSKLSPAEIKAEVLKNLRARREAIVALEPKGYVHMFRFGMCYREGEKTFVGLESATVRPTWERQVYRNRAGDRTECVHMNVAKTLALRSIDQAIATCEKEL